MECHGAQWVDRLDRALRYGCHALPLLAEAVYQNVTETWITEPDGPTSLTRSVAPIWIFMGCSMMRPSGHCSVAVHFDTVKLFGDRSWKM